MKKGPPHFGRGLITAIFLLAFIPTSNSFASEVMEETQTRVIVREHPQTGKPYVSIVSSEMPNPRDPFAAQRRKFSRPDYRMLDPKIKSGRIPYNGPSSDRTKIYVFAASLATLGTASAVLAPVAATTGVAASGGGGAYLAGGAAVVTGSAAAATATTKTDPKKENYTHRSESHLIKEEKDGPSDRD